MLTGGAEEASVFITAIFDSMFAASTANAAPQSVPRPFDQRRDGLVPAEGAGGGVGPGRARACSGARCSRPRAEVARALPGPTPMAPPPRAPAVPALVKRPRHALGRSVGGVGANIEWNIAVIKTLALRAAGQRHSCRPPRMAS